MTPTYCLGLGDGRPERTTCARCGAAVGLVKIGDGASFLVDAGTVERDGDRVRFILAPHDCGRSCPSATDAARRVLEHVSGRMRERPEEGGGA